MKSMNNQTNQELKDYSDQELTDELARRINNLSLDADRLIYPLTLIGIQYLKWYNEKKERPKQASE